MSAESANEVRDQSVAVPVVDKVDADRPPASDDTETDRLGNLRSELRELRQRFLETDERIAELKESQLQIGKGVVKAVHDGFENQKQGLSAICQDLREAVAQITESLQPAPIEEPEPDEDIFTVDAELAWTEAVFGPDLAGDPNLSLHLEDLRERLLAGERTVVSLAGHLMIFASAAPERRPQLLKELGEAYYRCCPKTRDTEGMLERLEQTLVASLQKSCGQAGFFNTIEIVRPGDRYDATRHSTVGKGGREVTQPHGWVVLRDNGKVYTKASVSVQ